MNFKDRITVPSKENILSQEGYFIWGASVIRDDVGMYHMFASRWEEEKTFASWLTHSRIVRAESQNPDGPYEVVEEITSLNTQAWSKKMAHNPTVKKIGDKYYLFYLGTTYSDDTPDVPVTTNTHPARFNQLIGVAVADRPQGPWIPSENNPIIRPREGEWDASYVCNPAVFVDGDEVRVIYKSKWSFPGKDENKLILGLAVANHPEGPYERRGPSPLFPYDVEDPYIWKEDSKYYMVVKDMSGDIAGRYNGVLLESCDCMDWKLSDNVQAWDHDIEFQDGTKIHPTRVERPQLLVEDGKPICLYIAIGDGKTYSYNLARRLNSTRRLNGRLQEQ